MRAGAETIDITPLTPQFLFGYPHVERISEGVHDPLHSSALYLTDERSELLIVANDVFSLSKQLVRAARARISQATAIPEARIMIAATHTHSGPVTVRMVGSEADPVIPAPDPGWLRQLEDGIVHAAVQARGNADSAEAGLTVADGALIGTNRHDPAGPTDPQVPVFVFRDVQTQNCIAAIVVCSCHPTILHEDSRLVSSDFPGVVRRYLREELWGPQCTTVWLTGPCGNQSPRHLTRGNTFAEADRLGLLLGESIRRNVGSIQYIADLMLRFATAAAQLPPRHLPCLDEARAVLAQARQTLSRLRGSGALAADVRTAECDVFGAEANLSLAHAASTGRLQTVLDSVLPAELAACAIGPWRLAFWPGECYVEYAMAVKRRDPNCFVTSLANGELQGYIVTEAAVLERRYEALNALFAGPDAGEIIVGRTLQLLREIGGACRIP